MLIIILGIWAVISIIVHIPSFPVERLAFLYNLALIPQWNFFAPNPPKGDLVLLFRDKMIGNTLSNWMEIKKNNRNKYFCWIWNPNKRFNKAHFDLINELISILNEIKSGDLESEVQSRFVIQTIPYLILLNYTFNYQKNSLAIQRQFAVLTSTKNGFDLVFTSNFHNL
jgi:hypothetical protein